MLSEDFYSPEQGFIYATDLVYAILYQAQDQNDEAIETYSNVIRHRYDHAIAYYLRGKLYQELGYVEQASGTSTITVSTQYRLFGISYSPLDRFFNTSRIGSMETLSCCDLYSSPGGETIEDLTLEPATPIQITYLDDAIRPCLPICLMNIILLFRVGHF